MQVVVHVAQLAARALARVKTSLQQVARHGVKRILYIEKKRGRGSAQKREALIKKLSRKEKLALIFTNNLKQNKRK